jgi:hypothetical protein
MEFLSLRPLRTREFLEERDGRCRLTPPLAHELAQTVALWRSLVAPVVDRLVDLLEHGERELCALVGITPRRVKSRVAALISSGRGRQRIATTVDRRGKRQASVMPEQRCQNCGETLSGKRCRDCGFAAVAFDDAGADRQRVVMMERQRANRDWTDDAGEVDFARDILPGLQAVTLRRIMEATGLSKRFASQIRNGLAVPHRRHWPALTRLNAGGDCSIVKLPRPKVASSDPAIGQVELI